MAETPLPSKFPPSPLLLLLLGLSLLFLVLVLVLPLPLPPPPPPPPRLLLLPLVEEGEEYEAASIKDKDKLRPARAAAEMNTSVISSGVSKTPSPGSYTTNTIPPDGLTTRATLSAKRVKLAHTTMRRRQSAGASESAQARNDN